MDEENKIDDEKKEKSKKLSKDGMAKDELEPVMNVPLNVSVELGRTTVTIKDLLQFTKGSVIELEKLAGEALEILVNDREVAKGEVVVVNEKFGIRLTDIINPLDDNILPSDATELIG